MTPTKEQIKAEHTLSRRFYRDIKLSDTAAKPLMVDELATAFATARLEARDKVRVLSFGHGALCVDRGTYDGKPALFISPAKTPGKVGSSSIAEGHPLDATIPGEIVLVFQNEDVVRTLHSLVCGDDVLSEARDKALEDARLVVAGWREHDWPEGFSRVSANILAKRVAAAIRAMKSTSTEPVKE